MKALFADSFYFLALLNEGDEAHSKAVTFSQLSDSHILTTAWVLTEVGDAFALPPARRRFLLLLEDLRTDTECTLLPASQGLFDLGVVLYSQRLDKGWSLTDCISFAAMRQHSLTEALTGDRHFEQAGFKALLK
jgi:hypothetical protein